jgi:tRNA U34 2-thiouridine synthase MnmA/TrmU
MSSDPIEKAPRINKTAVALISGGLDSALAIKLVQMQGIEVIALHFTSQFTAIDPRKKDTIVVESARELGVPLHFIKKGDDFVDIIRHPKHGHGKNLNPCIDCRIYTLKLAKQFMEEMGAGFLVTGEVVGQRPMSQLKNTLRNPS